MIVIGRCQEAAHSVVAELPQLELQRAPHQAVQCDVSDPECVKQTFQSLLAKTTKNTPLVLVNSAGVAINGLLARVSDTHIHTQCHTNLQGSMYTTRAVLRHMISSGGGCIVNIGSVIANTGSVGQSVYAATKAGLEGFTRSLAREVGPKGIRVNVVAPGYTNTDMTASFEDVKKRALLTKIPLGHFAEPQAIADAVLYLTSATYVTGTVLTIDGGLSC